MCFFSYSAVLQEPANNSISTNAFSRLLGLCSVSHVSSHLDASRRLPVYAAGSVLQKDDIPGSADADGAVAAVVLTRASSQFLRFCEGRRRQTHFCLGSAVTFSLRQHSPQAR